MGSAADLSIFTFGRAENRRASAPSHPNSVDGNVGGNILVAEAAKAPGMVLDLENLTPETLEAFFPSEHALVG